MSRSEKIPLQQKNLHSPDKGKKEKGRKKNTAEAVFYSESIFFRRKWNIGLKSFYNR